MMMTSSLLVFLSAAWAAPESGSSPFVLRTDDRVVFLGDTLTEGELDRRTQTTRPTYASYVETFVRVRYPKLKTVFLNAGWAGDTAERGLARLDRDVLSLKPTVVVVCYGLYDAGQKAYDKQLHERFQKAMTKLVERLREAGCRIYLMTPPSVDEHRNANLRRVAYNSVLSRYAETVRQIGQKFDVPVADWFAEITRQREARRKANANFSFSRFGMLPDAMGHVIGAVELLKVWNAEPLTVKIELNWHEKKATTTHGQAEAEAGDQPDQIKLHLRGCPMPWPVYSPIGRVMTHGWPGTDLIRILLYCKDAPDRITLSAGKYSRSRIALPVLGAQLVQGFNLAENEPFKSANQIVELWRYIDIKNNVRRHRWRDEEDRRPSSPELLEGHRKLMESYDAYYEGYRRIIDRLPRTLDLTLTLTAAKPATTRIAPRVRPGGKPVIRRVPGARRGVTTRPVRPLREQTGPAKPQAK